MKGLENTGRRKIWRLAQPFLHLEETAKSYKVGREEKNHIPGEPPRDRQVSVARRERNRIQAATWKEGNRQYVPSGDTLILVDSKPVTKDAISSLNPEEVRDRLMVCAYCIESQQTKGDRFDEEGCKNCRFGLLKMLPTLENDWAIEAAHSISLESLQVRNR